MNAIRIIINDEKTTFSASIIPRWVGLTLTSGFKTYVITLTGRKITQKIVSPTFKIKVSFSEWDRILRHLIFQKQYKARMFKILPRKDKIAFIERIKTFNESIVSSIKCWINLPSILYLYFCFIETKQVIKFIKSISLRKLHQ